MRAPVRFAHISDTHVMPDTIEWGQVFVDQLAEIGAGGYDFVLHTGDLMDEPSTWAARAFQALISQLQVPVYLVPGNHDVYNPPMGDIVAPWWAKLEVDSGLEKQYRNWFGPTWHVHSHRDVCLLGIDSLIINSGLSEEAEQWEWLEDTLAETTLQGPQHIVLFTHLPLFIWQRGEELDPADFANRYLVIAPPGRERLLNLIRRCRVTAVLSGHIHAPWQRSHTWPEGFTTHFVSTGCSKPSAMAIDQFDLPFSPAEGLGFHEHGLDGGGLVSRYHRHRPAACEGSWTLGTAWSCTLRDSQTPSTCDGRRWCEATYQPAIPEWRESAPAARCVLDGRAGDTLYLRQSFCADRETAALALEILTERALELYLNGELICKLEALVEQPPAWKSAGGSRTINSPLLHLPLNQRLVRRGWNSMALRVAKRPRAGWEGEEYIAFRSLIETGESGHE